MYYLASTWQWVLTVLGLGLAAVGLFVLARWSWRWVLVVVVVVLGVVFLAVLPWFVPASSFLEDDLPPLFKDHFWAWMLGFVLGLLFTTIALARMLRAARPAAQVEAQAADLAGRFPELDAAWDEIQTRLAQAQIDLGTQRVVLILAPHEDWSAALVRAAGLALLAEAPEAAAPIHAYATLDGVLLSVAGASAFGTQDGDATVRLGYLCQRLLAEHAECPIVRGVVVVVPISWAGQPESVTWAAAVRDDLRTISRVLRVRCPVFAVVTQMETAPGFAEFLARMSSVSRQGRCGFTVPSTHRFSGELVQRGLVWMSGWFQVWILSLLADDPLDQAGNTELFVLGHEFRRYRNRLRAILEAAFSTPRDAEPVLFRGCYFAATGTEPEAQAFGAGVLRGPHGRVVTDHHVTRWTAQAEADDRGDRRLALAVAVVGGLAVLAGWALILALSGDRRWGLGLAAVVVAWAVALVRIGRGPRPQARA